MITAKDIRIDNYILIDGKHYIVDSVSKNPFELYVKGIDYNYALYAEPIPLTPELLEKLILFENDEREFIFKTQNHVFYFQFIDVKSYCFFVNGIEVNNLKGFHHLQNILWDLCQIELTL